MGFTTNARTYEEAAAEMLRGKDREITRHWSVDDWTAHLDMLRGVRLSRGIGLNAPKKGELTKAISRARISRFKVGATPQQVAELDAQIAAAKAKSAGE